MGKNKISAIVLTKNEEKNIARCLKSILFCDEIIIIDDYSTDTTLDIVRQTLRLHQNYKIIQRRTNEDFSDQRNYAITQASNLWILYIDADEAVSHQLKQEIIRWSNHQSDKSAYYLKRRDWFWGRELRYGETKKIREKGIIRLVKKGSGDWQGVVHEQFISDQPIGRFNQYLDHYPHPTIKEFINKVNYYSSLRANELFLKGQKAKIWQIILFPTTKFILTYFLYLGLLDGAAGFAYALIMSFHSFLVRAKLWQKQAIKKTQPQ